MSHPTPSGRAAAHEPTRPPERSTGGNRASAAGTSAPATGIETGIETGGRRHDHPVDRPPALVAWAAALWCLVYGSLGAYWASGGAGFPFGHSDANAESMGSWLAAATPGPTGAVIAVGCAAGVVAALAAVMPWGRRLPRRPLAAVLFVLATPLLLAAPDVRILQNLAYSLFGNVSLVDWPVLNQALCVAGGILLAATATQVLRRPPCAACGRPPAAPDDRRRWTRIGRWATAVAVLAPLPYAAQRAAWNLGIPLGVDEAFVRALAADFQSKGINPILAYSLTLGAVGGALLTTGLAMSWGETFPRWVPYLGGRRVPVTMAVIPATVVTVAVTVAGLAVWRWALLDGGINGSAAPGLLWVPWGIALGVATLAYHRRRRNTCPGRPDCPGRLDHVDLPGHPGVPGRSDDSGLSG
ncbi:hypothetical protein ACIBCT_28795 [Streptosporangium sp. NPDC050855]|uniref:hypothetical protein n=1 Tax=Streptosporangium sp. NPDC050855 TaxID=3366194 RepID=UPI0037B68122